MLKQRSNYKSAPVGTVAPISKKLTAGPKPKSGTGYSAKASSGKSSGSAFGTSGKSSNSQGIGGKASNSGISPTIGSKSSTFGKSDSSKSSSPPILIGSKRSTAFTTGPSKSYASTSFSTPKKTTFGIIWIPTRRHNKKKDYVYVPHNYEKGKERTPSMYHYDHMSGDTPHNQSIKKKDEESMLLAIEKPKGPIATAASAGTVVATVESTQANADPTSPEEKQDAIKYEKQGSEEAAGDAKFSKDNTDDKSYLENECLTNRSQENKWEKDRGDNVDSVYLRPPPQHKVRPSSPNNDDEDCGIKCLYYTLQCCDCVLQ